MDQKEKKKVGFGFSLQKKSSKKNKRKVFGDEHGRVLTPIDDSPFGEKEGSEFKPANENLFSVIKEHSRKAGPRVVLLPTDKIIVHSDQGEDDEEEKKPLGKPPVLKNGLNLLKRPRGVAVGDPNSSTRSVKRMKPNEVAAEVEKSEGTVTPEEEMKITIKNTSRQPQLEDTLEGAAVKEILREVEEAETLKAAEDRKREIKMDATKQRILSKRMIGLDAEHLDSDTSFRQYSRSPIDGFGAAMLRGMGWREGAKIGGTNKANVKPYIAHKRARRQGLGAAPIEKKRNRKWIPKPGDEKKPSKQSSTRPKTVNGQASPTSKETAPASREVKKKQLRWVHEGLRVRLITEDFGKKYWRKKGVIVAIESCYHFSIKMDDGKRKVLKNVVEADIETHVPRVGNRIEILSGDFKGHFGVIREKRKDKGVAFVQVEQELEIVKLSFDDICSFA